MIKLINKCLGAIAGSVAAAFIYLYVFVWYNGDLHTSHKAAVEEAKAVWVFFFEGE